MKFDFFEYYSILLDSGHEILRCLRFVSIEVMEKLNSWSIRVY